MGDFAPENYLYPREEKLFLAQKAKVLPAHGGTVKYTSYSFRGNEVRGRVDGDVLVTQKRLLLMSKEDKETLDSRPIPSFELFFDPDLAAETIISRRRAIAPLESNKSDVKLFVKIKKIRLLTGVGVFQGARWGVYAGKVPNNYTGPQTLSPLVKKDAGVSLHVENVEIANNNPKYHGGMGGLGAWMFGAAGDVDATDWAIDYDTRRSTESSYDSMMNLIGSKGESMLDYADQIRSLARDPNQYSSQPFQAPNSAALAEPTPAGFCTKCGKSLAVGAIFCTSCGNPVKL